MNACKWESNGRRLVFAIIARLRSVLNMSV